MDKTYGVFEIDRAQLIADTVDAVLARVKPVPGSNISGRIPRSQMTWAKITDYTSWSTGTPMIKHAWTEQRMNTSTQKWEDVPDGITGTTADNYVVGVNFIDQYQVGAVLQVMKAEDWSTGKNYWTVVPQTGAWFYLLGVLSSSNPNVYNGYMLNLYSQQIQSNQNNATTLAPHDVVSGIPTFLPPTSQAVQAYGWDLSFAASTGFGGGFVASSPLQSVAPGLYYGQIMGWATDGRPIVGISTVPRGIGPAWYSASNDFFFNLTPSWKVPFGPDASTADTSWWARGGGTQGGTDTNHVSQAPGLEVVTRVTWDDSNTNFRSLYSFSRIVQFDSSGFISAFGAEKRRLIVSLSKTTVVSQINSITADLTTGVCTYSVNTADVMGWV